MDELDSDGSRNIRDEICGYASKMNSRSRLLSGIIRDGSGSARQRKALIEMFSDPRVADTAWEYGASIKFTDEECTLLEKFSEEDAVREIIVMKILLQNPTGIQHSIKRLLTGNAGHQTTAKILQEYLKKKEKHKDLGTQPN